MSADLSRTDSYQYPAAHIGHLNPAQQTALNAFKELCETEGYYFPKGKDGNGEPSHDDETLLRYLRARRFIPKDALGQFKDTENWRKENHLDELYTQINVTEYEETRKLYPQWTGRRDKRGIPIYLFEVAPLNSKTLAAYEEHTAKFPPPVKFNANKVPTKMLRLFALYENLTTFILPLCTAIKGREHPETPISQSNNIVDISKVGLKQFWYLKGHMQDASTLATAHYPETLDRIFIIGAPAFFPTVWGWIKRWFDPITVSKIFILSASEVRPTLERYIDLANIPKKYGGQLDFEFGMMPNIEPDIDSALTWEDPVLEGTRKTFPKGPIAWELNDQKEWCATAVGTEDGILRRKIIAKLAPGLSVKAAQEIPNKPLDRPALERMETGNYTHPPVDESAKPYDSSEPPSESPSGTNTPATRAATTAPLPPSALNPAHPDVDVDVDAATKGLQDTRLGTSETRFAQQEPTLAAGQMAEGTPAVNHHAGGDKTVSMEPGTVGQAPKDVSAPITDRSEHFEAKPGYVEQAKGVAGSVVGGASAVAGAIAGAVGYGGKTEEGKEVKEERKEDPAVDAAGKGNVEEFLRSQVVSKEKDKALDSVG